MTIRHEPRPVMSAAAARGSAPIALSRPVLVGVDGSPGSEAAAIWAAAEAGALAVPLRVIGTYMWELLDPWTSPADALILAKQHKGCDYMVNGIVSSLHRDFPDLDVFGEVVHADPRDLLSERGDDASMIVVGTRHLGPLGRAVLGSVSTHLAATAPCPVIVLRGASTVIEEHPAVVAGIAGGPETSDILAFAFAHAQAHRLPVRTVLCWRPLLDRVGTGGEPPVERAEQWLAEAVAGWRDRYPDVEVDTVVVRDHPVSGLVGAATSQHLLVVGRRRQRSRFGAHLGSVSQGVVHHASCPVAVIPASKAAAS